MKKTILICGSHKNSIGKLIGEKLIKDYHVRYFSRKNSDIKCDISNPESVKSMLKSLENKNVKSIINTAGIPYRINSTYEEANKGEITKFFQIKLLGLLNLALYGRQIFQQPFDLIQIGGATLSKDPQLVHYAMANGAMESFIHSNHDEKINTYFISLGPVKETHMLQSLFKEKTIKEWERKELLNDVEEIYTVINSIFNGQVKPGKTIKIGNFGGI